MVRKFGSDFNKTGSRSRKTLKCCKSFDESQSSIAHLEDGHDQDNFNKLQINGSIAINNKCLLLNFGIEKWHKR